MSIKVGNKDNARKELAKLQEGIFNHVNNKTINHNHNHSGAVMHGKLDVNKLSKDQLDKILMIDQDNNQQLQINMNEYDDNIIEGEIIEPDDLS